MQKRVIRSGRMYGKSRLAVRVRGVVQRRKQERAGGRQAVGGLECHHRQLRWPPWSSHFSARLLMKPLILGLLVILATR